MRRLAFTALRAAALVLALLGVLGLTLTAVGLALARGWQREALRESLALWLSQQTGLRVSIGGLEGPLYPRLVLRDVALFRGSRRLLELGELQIRYRLDEIPRGRLAIDSLAAVSPRLELEGDGPGEWNFRESAAETVVRLPLELALGSLEVSDARFDLHWGDANAPSFARGRLDAAARSIVLRRDASFAAPARATADLQLEAAELAGSGLAGHWSGSGQLELEARSGATLRDGAIAASLELGADDAVASGSSRIELRGRMRAGHWAIESARARTPLGNAELAGSGDFERIEALSGRAELPDLRPLARWLGDHPAVAGSGRLDFELRGDWRNPEGTLALELDSLRVREVEIGSVELALASHADRRIHIERLAIRGPELRLQSEGSGSLAISARGVGFDELRLRSEGQRLEFSGSVERGRFVGFGFDAAELELDPLLALWPSAPRARGRLSATVRLDGPFSQPKIDAQGRWERLRIGELALDRLRFLLAADDAGLRTEWSLRDARRGELEASLRTAHPPPARIRDLLSSTQTELRFATPGFDLSGLGFEDRVRQLEGRLAGELELRGRAGLPQLRGQLSIRGAFERSESEGRIGPIEASLRFSPDALEVEKLVIGGDSPLELRAAASFAAEPQDGMALRISALRLEWRGWEVSTNGPAELRLRGSELSIEQLRLATTAGSLELSGRLRRERVEALRLRCEALEIDPLARLAGLGDELSGALAADLHFEGAYELPSLEGWLEIREPGYRELRADLARVSVHTDDARLRGDLRLKIGGEERLSADWSLPHRAALHPSAWLEDPATSIALRAVQLDAGWFAPLAPRAVADPEGKLDIRLELVGRPGAPELRGGAQLSAGKVSVPALRQTYAPIRASASLSPDALRIESLELGAGEGFARISGSIGLTAGLPSSADLRLRADSLQLGERRGLSARVDGDLWLHGPLASLALQGSLKLSRGRLSIADAEERLMREIRVRGLPSAEPGPARDERSSMLPSVSELDLEVEVQRNSWIRSDGTALDVEGAVRVQRTAQGEPSYAGTLHVVRGTYSVQGRDFEIRSGSATFSGGSELDPLLEATGVRRVRGIEILAALRGRASAPEIRLSSTPPLSEDDILSYLAFGKPRDELRGSAGADLGGTATALAGGVAAHELSEELRGLLAVDVLDIRMDGSSGKPNAAIGTYLTDDLFVRFGQDLRLEWTLSPSFRIESEVRSDEETSGVDLIWQYDY